MTSFLKVLQNSFKVMYCNQTTIETATLPNSVIFISFVLLLSPNWAKKSKVVYHVLRVIERLKSIFDGTLK